MERNAATARLPGRRVPRGFTLVEALVAISLAALAGTVILLGMNGSLKVTDDAMNGLIATGMAQQLMDEIAGAPYAEAGESAWQTTLGPDSNDRLGGSRERFDDIGDYGGYSSQPPVDPWGIALGCDDGEGGQRHESFRVAGALGRWRQVVTISYVNENDLSQGLPLAQTSDYRAIEVRILYDLPVGGQRELAKIRRVVPYVPTLP